MYPPIYVYDTYTHIAYIYAYMYRKEVWLADLWVHAPLRLQDALGPGVQQLLVLDEPVVLLLG
jgi:hypothetical protein